MVSGGGGVGDGVDEDGEDDADRSPDAELVAPGDRPDEEGVNVGSAEAGSGEANTGGDAGSGQTGSANSTGSAGMWPAPSWSEVAGPGSANPVGKPGDGAASRAGSANA